MNVIEAIRARRAVRDYVDRPVEAETVKALLRAAVQAPSAMNHQPWRFAVVQDTARLKRYSDSAKELLLGQLAGDHKIRAYRDVLSSPAFNIFYNAGTLVTICTEERSPYSEADAWLAAENLMLAACEAGLGTCCIGFAVGVLNTPEVKQELRVPSDGAAIVPIIVGYPRAIPAPVPAMSLRSCHGCGDAKLPQSILSNADAHASVCSGCADHSNLLQPMRALEPLVASAGNGRREELN